ncbi:hypothetical protein [Anabaena sp. PCC 7938]|uniref:hypothetical protein n=1 Tax=Anabaena sp. PCC 7938 TaxID=1296340 RepID=UPI00202FB13E|nr:hypothetical protein [Anabaena sp. CCAP 1446/1C]
MQSKLFLDKLKVMTGKKGIKILTEILDLSGVKVVSHRLHTGIGMILKIEQEKSFSTCPKCGINSKRNWEPDDFPISPVPSF